MLFRFVFAVMMVFTHSFKTIHRLSRPRIIRQFVRQSSNALIRFPQSKDFSLKSTKSSLPASAQLSYYAHTASTTPERKKELEIEQKLKWTLQKMEVTLERMDKQENQDRNSSVQQDNRTFTCLSFYHFQSMTPDQCENIKTQLKQKLPALDPLIKGTLLISPEEGVNAQFVMPTERVDSFQTLLESTDSSVFNRQRWSFNIGEIITIPKTDVIATKAMLARVLEDQLPKLFVPIITEKNMIPANHDQHFHYPSEKLVNQFFGKIRKVFELYRFPSSHQLNQSSSASPTPLYRLERLYEKLMRAVHYDITKYYTNFYPFKKLSIKEKKQILTDGLLGKGDDELTGKQRNKIDWSDAGAELAPNQWHEEIASKLLRISYNTKDGSSSTPSASLHTTPTLITKDFSELRPISPLDDTDTPILLDCRNDIESDLGTFQSAIPLNTSSFNQTFDRLDVLLKELPKNQRILTFCTGGIRCVKVNAYLKQQLGFQNIGRLEKGIIAYEKWVEEQVHDTNGRIKNYVEKTREEISRKDGGVRKNQNHQIPIQSLFIGKNFLFDRRRLFESSFET